MFFLTVGIALDQIKQLGLDGIGMIKRSAKVYYRYNASSVCSLVWIAW